MSKEDTQWNIGKILTGKFHRDAIHIAVIPVIADKKLAPGQDVGFVDKTSFRVGFSMNNVGIVDPFLKKMVQPDEQFFLFLYPNTVTGLRHEYEHPSLKGRTDQRDEDETVLKARAVLEEIAQRGETTVEYLLDCGQSGEAPRFGTEMYDVDQQDKDKFWDAIQVLTGYKASQSLREEYWSCAC